MDRRVTPAARQASRFAGVQSVGFASRVISRSTARAAKRVATAVIAAAMQRVSQSDGVPPPT